eukprot:954519-Prymnesium_polylepis.1
MSSAYNFVWQYARRDATSRLFRSEEAVVSFEHATFARRRLRKLHVCLILSAQAPSQDQGTREALGRTGASDVILGAPRTSDRPCTVKIGRQNISRSECGDDAVFISSCQAEL